MWYHEPLFKEWIKGKSRNHLAYTIVLSAVKLPRKSQHMHGGSKEKEKQLWKTVVFRQLKNERDRVNFLKLNQTIYSNNSFKSLKCCWFLWVKCIFQIILCFCHVKQDFLTPLWVRILSLFDNKELFIQERSAHPLEACHLSEISAEWCVSLCRNKLFIWE